jgi:hypothetical protein
MQDNLERETYKQQLRLSRDASKALVGVPEALDMVICIADSQNPDKKPLDASKAWSLYQSITSVIPRPIMAGIEYVIGSVRRHKMLRRIIVAIAVIVILGLTKNFVYDPWTIASDAWSKIGSTYVVPEGSRVAGGAFVGQTFTPQNIPLPLVEEMLGIQFADAPSLRVFWSFFQACANPPAELMAQAVANCHRIFLNIFGTNVVTTSFTQGLSVSINLVLSTGKFIFSEVVSRGQAVLDRGISLQFTNFDRVMQMMKNFTLNLTDWHGKWYTSFAAISVFQSRLPEWTPGLRRFKEINLREEIENRVDNLAKYGSQVAEDKIKESLDVLQNDTQVGTLLKASEKYDPLSLPTKAKTDYCAVCRINQACVMEFTKRPMLSA